VDERLSVEEKYKVLRAKSADELVDVAKAMQTAFMPVTDDEDGFIPSSCLELVLSGELGRRLKASGVRVLIGEASEERAVFDFFTKHRGGAKFRFSDSLPNREALASKLREQFPKPTVETLLRLYADNSKTWSDMYCDIMADTQYHAPIRGLVQCLVKGGMMPGVDLFRYQTA
jgi:carboxylesterase type B